MTDAEDGEIVKEIERLRDEQRELELEIQRMNQDRGDGEEAGADDGISTRSLMIPTSSQDDAREGADKAIGLGQEEASCHGEVRGRGRGGGEGLWCGFTVAFAFAGEFNRMGCSDAEAGDVW
ncbi:hypothetical protein Bca52824_040746 [Brassica carinata]|uniref:Uncharacterized protein n=1 Tax=Brassica carinata TaxID=52824 RepID=A0A8X7UX38_BRACI|nr:hypothetical protein Bca52824_040746 [Brassica carinata]